MPSLSRFLATLLLAAAAVVPPLARASLNADHLGARYDATRTHVTFNVYSSRATRVELRLYKAASGVQESARIVLAKGSNNVWTATLATTTIAGYGISGTIYYGYRAWGPNWPYNTAWTPGTSTGFISDVDTYGNRFNPNKLLTDPYAKELSHDPTTPSMTDGTKYASGALYRNIDSGNVAPKGIVLAADTTSIGTKPTRAFKDDVVYEVHARGLTMYDSSIASAYRGTYKGAGLKAAYLASLGVTTVEFLPVQET